MRRSVAFVGSSMVLGAVAGGAAIVWHRNPRVGTTFMNSVVNPSLLRRGLAGSGVDAEAFPADRPGLGQPSDRDALGELVSSTP